MAEIIEILFENIEFNEASSFITDLSFQGNIKNIQVSVDDGFSLEDGNNNLLDIGSYFKKCSGGAIYINMENVQLNNKLLPKIGVQILKYTNIYDLCIDVGSQQLQELIPLESLQKWASNVSQRLRSESYYCGLEPASDEDTRFFSNGNFGPLEFKKELS